MVARDFCQSHWKMARDGKPLRRRWAPRGLTPQERIEYYSTPPTEKGCRIWLGSTTKQGYPTMSSGKDGRCKPAHRVAYECAGNKLDHRPLHHKCGNRLCVEPTHMQLVEPYENTAEMFERNFYVKRITALELALKEVIPDHPLLAVEDGS